MQVDMAGTTAVEREEKTFVARTAKELCGVVLNGQCLRRTVPERVSAYDLVFASWIKVVGLTTVSVM